MAEWRASGLTATQFCADEGLNPSSLYHWSWRLGREKVQSAPDERDESTIAAPRLLRVVPTASRAQVPKPSTGSIEISVGRLRVAVCDQFDAATLSAVLDVLERRTAEER